MHLVRSEREVHATGREEQMNQAIDTHKYTIGLLLGRYERRPVILPAFQRSYSWEKAQLSLFWADLIAFNSVYVGSPKTASYFFGSIVVIETDEQILLLDGQQRLATATVACAAIRDLARSLDKPGLTKGADFARDIQRELLEKDTDPVSYALTLSEIDEPFFRSAIKIDPPTYPVTKLRPHLLIKNAYDISRATLEKLIHGQGYEDALKTLRDLHDALTKGFTLIGIVVQNEDDAYNIFETLNDRGLRLSVPDLVLNLLMRRAPDNTARKLLRQHWNSMLRQMGRRDVSRFLRHMWVSMYGDVKSEGLYGAIKRDLEAKKINSVDFAQQCEDECEAYVAILDQNIALPKDGQANLEGLVKYLGAASVPPLLLAGYRSLDQYDFVKLLAATVTTFVRYGLVANQNPLDIESTFYSAARQLRAAATAGESSAKRLQLAKAELKKLTIADNIVEEAASDLILERSEAIWLMTQLANSQQSATKEVAMSQANLEHVFPQNAGVAWPNRAELEPLIWHLGNLTILGEKINRQAQNKSFSDKTTLHYKSSEIEMAKELLTFSTWDEIAIRKRAAELAKRIVKTWPPLP
jgi:hypothetical protein